MEAPDKIFLTPKIDDESQICSLWFNKKQVGENFEYIRKDTLLKWVKEEIRKANTAITPEMSKHKVFYYGGKEDLAKELIKLLETI